VPDRPLAPPVLGRRAALCAPLAGLAATVLAAGCETGDDIAPSTSSTSSTSSPAQTYRLIANPTALSEHVGKKLELTGTLDPTSTADPKDPSAAAPALRVQSGKIVAATCSE